MERKYRNDDTIKVAFNSDVERTVYYCQKLLTKRKEINLCSIGNAIQTLKRVINELLKRNPDYYIFFKIDYIDKGNNKKNKKFNLKKEDVKIFSEEPKEYPEGYFRRRNKDNFKYFNDMEDNNNNNTQDLLIINRFHDTQPEEEEKKEVNLDVIEKPIESSSKETYNEISIYYKAHNNKKQIKLFGDLFFNNNKNKCKMSYNGKITKLKNTLPNEHYKVKDYSFGLSIELINEINGDHDKYEIIEIKLIDFQNITNFSYMFDKCSALYSISDLSKIQMNYSTDLSFMFNGCSSLISLPDISNWNTSKVNNINSIFCNCSSLKSLPDISKWNTSSMTNISEIFSNCENLSVLPDISKWDISKATNLYGIFNNCKSLIALPDISKWNISKAKYISKIFSNCSSLKSLPDISNWDISNVLQLSDIFYNCSSLEYLPDISKWDISKFKSMEGFFLIYLHWNLCQIYQDGILLMSLI